MTHPTFDRDGYPTEETLQAIREWKEDWRALFSFLCEAWEYPDRWRRGGDTYAISTGGWSGNEELIDALRDNAAAWSSCFVSEARGGHYVFKVPG